MVKIFLLAVLVVGLDAFRISDKQNVELQASCGMKAGYHRKVINGELANRGDHPWAASVNIRYMNHTTNRTLLGPGTLISSRHILAYNLVRIDGSYKLSLGGLEGFDATASCKGEHLELPEEMVVRYDIDFDHFQQLNSSREFKETVAKITIINGCKKLGPEDLMVITLKEDVEIGTKTRAAACISNSPKNWFAAEQFSVYGMNREGYLVSGKFAPTNCSTRVPFSCATAVEKNQGLCQGDFGGSAVANIDERFTMLGVYASGNTKCRADPSHLPDFQFVNIGYFREEICYLTGVCVAPPHEDVTHIPPFGSYTTEGTERPTTGEPEPIETTPESAVTPDFASRYPDLDFTTRGTGIPHETTTEAPVETTADYDEGNTTEDYPDYQTEPTDYDTTPIEEEEEVPTTQAPRIGEDGEVIVAETFEPHPIGNCTRSSEEEIGDEDIAVERPEPMPLDHPTRGHRVDINIHIHL